MRLTLLFLCLLPGLLLSETGRGQRSVHSPAKLPQVGRVEPQPLLAQAIRLEEALSFLGSALPGEDARRLKALQDRRLSPEVVNAVQDILDPYCLAMVEINPEARVKVIRGPAKPVLSQGGWTSFLVKVHNEAGVTAQLNVQSPNAAPLLHISSSEPKALPEHLLTRGQVEQRFLEMQLYRERPLQSHLSGLLLEYAVLQVYSKDAGQREAGISFNIGQGTQDIGFRNAFSVLFNIRPSVRTVLQVKDDNGAPATASFTITDGVERFPPDTDGNREKTDYRLTLAQQDYRVHSKALTGIYPLPSRRVAAYDEYPDFFFQPQVYRADGEHVQLPPGKYKVTVARGPEYIPQTTPLVIPEGKDSVVASFRLKRWVNMAELGWYSADHHVHAAGCSHYESPGEGVTPDNIWRQVLGEDLNIAAVLSWGPGWYHQKEFFTGQVHPLSTRKNIMRYDVEVSGFPSSHAGHVVLLRLKEDDYPGAGQIEDWPSWTLPVLKWAKAQGGITGYAHSGWGLEPLGPARGLPNNVVPKMDGVGANEYIVTVTQQAVDFYSAGDTPAPWELNMWYHTLNCGFRVSLSGETDFPCIFDERVGMARSYFKPDSGLNYDGYVAALKKGRAYVSDGGSHIIDLTVNNTGMGTGDVSLQKPAPVTVKARVAAYLPPQPGEKEEAIRSRPPEEQPYWHIERARIGASQQVPVELIVNGEPVDTAVVNANGQWHDLTFSYPVTRSCWIALRIYPSSHTNPVFVTVDGQPVRVAHSANWCRQTVDQCWKMKQNAIRPAERSAAAAAYDQARRAYERILQEAKEK